MSRRAAKIDFNQPTIVAALKKVGASVQSLAMVGDGCPDLLVGFLGKWYVLEVKDGAKIPSKRKLTPDQVRWHAEHRGPVHVVETVDQALLAIGAVAHAPRFITFSPNDLSGIPTRFTEVK